MSCHLFCRVYIYIIISFICFNFDDGTLALFNNYVTNAEKRKNNKIMQTINDADIYIYLDQLIFSSFWSKEVCPDL